MNAKKQLGKVTLGNVLPSTIFTGDNLPILRGMQSESVDLIYLDPPFNSNRHYEAPIGSRAAGASFKDAWTLDDVDLAWHGEIAEQNYSLYKTIEAAKEVHTDGMALYIMYMAVRLIEMDRLLKNTGSIYLHCDPTASHYLKLVMDSIFGFRNFRNDISWCYTGPQRIIKHYPRKHDCLLFYAKGKNVFNKDTIRIDSKWNELGGYSNEQVARINIGKVPEDWWPITFGPRNPERVGYPTQKPLALLHRIIKASSNQGDTVLDPFCGCATACVAAQDTGRNWVGIDISKKAYQLILYRFEKELGLLSPKIHHRTDIPQRAGVKTRDIKNILYGEQGGYCKGCKHHFRPQNLTVDHVVPLATGGIDADENLQLLCGHCNSIKGNRPMKYLIAELNNRGYLVRKNEMRLG